MLRLSRFGLGKSRLRQRRSKVKRAFQPQMLRLEDRCTPATFTVTNVNNAGAGSLRQAILDANANPGHDVIRFGVGANLGGPIKPTASLPNITSPITMDGSRLFIGTIEIPNQSGRPLVEIDGSQAGNGTEGLHLDVGAAGSVIRGLVINRFDDDGIALAGSNMTVQNCWIGLDTDGTAAGNGAAGIRLIGSSSNDLIGGPLVTQRNIISDQAVGIATGGGAGTKTNNTIQNNFIGTNLAGTAAIGNNFGIFLSNAATNSQIISNVISGNFTYGVVLSQSTVSGITVKSNRIGVAGDGTTPLPNGNIGVLVAEASHDNTIGGTAAGDGNIIAFNGQTGVAIGSDPTNITLSDPAGNGNRVLGNQIFGTFTVLLVSADGINFPAQDTLDTDSGPNDLQNFPVLNSATKSSDNTNITVNGSLSSRASRSYRIEVFAFDNDLLVGGTIQNMTFIGATNVTTNASGIANFNTVFATPSPLPVNARILATATDLTTGDTSNFSVNVAATSFPMIQGDTLTPLIHEGEFATLSGQLVDTDPQDFLTLRVDWGDGGRPQNYHPGTDPFAVTHLYGDDGVYDVTFSWFAQQGGVKSRTKQVTVLNAVPTFGLLDVQQIGRLVKLDGAVNNPGKEPLQVQIDWGDGAQETLDLRRGDDSFSARHHYRQPGIYSIHLIVLDDDGSQDELTRLVSI